MGCAFSMMGGPQQLPPLQRPVRPHAPSRPSGPNLPRTRVDEEFHLGTVTEWK